MKKKTNLFVSFLLILFVQISFAQERIVKGKVSDASGSTLAGASVKIKGTKKQTLTDQNGNFSISATNNDVLIVGFIGFETAEISVNKDNFEIKLKESNKEIEQIVVTALGIKREKKSLGYATQEIKGDAINDVPVTNFANALQGEVAGLNVQSFGTIGGSANIVVRGYSSITGNNQALIVIDGTPVINETNNSAGQKTGRGGYDYGNAAMDINPDDIESVNVLKGAAATALYGSRANAGALIITTKKGKKKEGFGISFNSSLTVASADKSTLPKYQDKYGAGYGPYYSSPDGYFDFYDINGDGSDDLVVPFGEDASYGAAFNPNLLVYQWNSIYPGLPKYGQATPWVAAQHTPNDLYESGITTTNSVSFGKSNKDNAFRIGFTNKIQGGVLPNQRMLRNNLTFAAMQKINDKLKGSVDFSYVNSSTKGRNGTGYDSRNPMQAFRQWFQTNVDIYEQRDAFFATGQNATWNATSPTELTPLYTDNVYWTLFKNYQTDKRDRYYGNLALEQEVTKWFNLLGRFSFDSYSEIREERIDVGSVDPSNYTVTNRKAAEMNYDLIANFNYDFTSDLNFQGMLGFNMRVNKLNSLALSTNGGLITPGLFTITNSVNALTAADMAKVDYTKKVDGIYARASFGYKNTYYLDGTIRRDRSSALPKENNTYYYPSISTSVIFSNLLQKDWLSFGKFRANYAKVGNDTDPYRIFNTYDINPAFNGSASASNISSFNNPNLKNESSRDIELGLEMQLFKNRFGFDVSYYNRKTTDLITPLDVSTSTGAVSIVQNAGDVQNKGLELILNGKPIKTASFSWDVKVNFAKNRSEVTRLAEGISFIQLGSVQGGVTLGAQLGEPYGVIRGRDFIYHENGQPIVGTNGYYLRTANSDVVIGDINPDWIGGIKNTFNYKNFNLSFLIDVKKGGDVFSLDTYYGYATGLYDFTAGTNHLGNPVRNPVSQGGGVILDGVQANGTPNTVVASATTYANPWGYVRTPQAAHVYDASFIKLREVSMSYNVPSKIASSLKVDKITLSLIGRNLWIIHKNVPYADPEAGLSAGNIQGNQSGSYPSLREIGANIKFEF